jgi:hypothetical protein
LLSKMLRFSAAARISMFDARGHKFHEDSNAAVASAATQLPAVCEEQVHSLSPTVLAHLI